MEDVEKIAEDIIQVVEKSIYPGTLAKTSGLINKKEVYISGQSYENVKKNLIYYINNKMDKEK